MKMIKDTLLKIKKGLAQESLETKQMLIIYQKYVAGKATSDELKFANDQFKDLLKSAGVGFLFVMPLAPLTLPLAIKLGKMVGIDLIPSWFKMKDSKPK